MPTTVEPRRIGRLRPRDGSSLRTQSAPRRPPIRAARNGSHVVTGLAGGRWIDVFIYVRRSGEDKEEAGRCGVTPACGGGRGGNGSRFESDPFQGAAQTSSQITLCGG